MYVAVTVLWRTMPGELSLMLGDGELFERWHRGEPSALENFGAIKERRSMSGSSRIASETNLQCQENISTRRGQLRLALALRMPWCRSTATYLIAAATSQWPPRRAVVTRASAARVAATTRFKAAEWMAVRSQIGAWRSHLAFALTPLSQP